MKLPTPKRAAVKHGACILGGALLYALAFNLFLNGNHIAAGGLSGVATVLTNVLPISPTVIITVFNIPLLVVSLFVKGWKFTRNTLLGSAAYSLAVGLTAGLPTLSANPLVAAVFGGALYGLGVALLARGNGSTGGTDLINRMLAGKFRNLSLGKIGMIVDGSIVVLSMVVFRNIEVGLYAIITIYVYTAFADKIMLGFDRANLCFIITGGDPEGLIKGLMTKLHRSVTKLEGEGMYSGTGRSVLMTVVRPSEAPALKDLVSELEPDAFVVVAQANEVLGGSFKAFPLPPVKRVG